MVGSKVVSATVAVVGAEDRHINQLVNVHVFVGNQNIGATAHCRIVTGGAFFVGHYGVSAVHMLAMSATRHLESFTRIAAMAAGAIEAVCPPDRSEDIRISRNPGTIVMAEVGATAGISVVKATDISSRCRTYRVTGQGHFCGCLSWGRFAAGVDVAIVAVATIKEVPSSIGTTACAVAGDHSRGVVVNTMTAGQSAAGFVTIVTEKSSTTPLRRGAAAVAVGCGTSLLANGIIISGCANNRSVEGNCFEAVEVSTAGDDISRQSREGRSTGGGRFMTSGTRHVAAYDVFIVGVGTNRTGATRGQVIGMSIGTSSTVTAGTIKPGCVPGHRIVRGDRINNATRSIQVTSAVTINTGTAASGRARCHRSACANDSRGSVICRSIEVFNDGAVVKFNIDQFVDVISDGHWAIIVRSSGNVTFVTLDITTNARSVLDTQVLVVSIGRQVCRIFMAAVTSHGTRPGNCGMGRACCRGITMTVGIGTFTGTTSPTCTGIGEGIEIDTFGLVRVLVTTSNTINRAVVGSSHAVTGVTGEVAVGAVIVDVLGVWC